MTTAEDIILQHASSRYNPATYDPVKRRERYLRTRQLKGRHPAAVKPVTGKKPSGSDHSGVDLNEAAKKRRAQRTKEINQRVIELSFKLDRLRENLRELVRLAKARSGVETQPTEQTKATTTTKKAEPAGSKKQTDTKPKTASQKREAAKQSKEYYEEHKTEISKQQKIQELQKDIKVTQQKILRARRYLKTAAAKARNDVVTNRPAAKSPPKS